MRDEMRAAGEKNPTPQKINRRIRAVEGYAGPGSSFLSHAKRTHEVFPDFLVSKPKNFQTVRQIAVAAIPDAVKHELRKALEDGATQAEIRQKIRDSSDAARECDFKVQVSNCWRFGKNPLPAAFDGGIHPELARARPVNMFSCSPFCLPRAPTRPGATLENTRRNRPPWRRGTAHVMAGILAIGCDETSFSPCAANFRRWHYVSDTQRAAHRPPAPRPRS